MALDTASFNAAMKQNYPDSKVENMTYENSPLFALLRKDETFGGDVMKIPLLFGNPQNRSTVFSTANQMASTSQVKAFMLTRAKDYSLAEIDNEVLLSTEGDANAFLRAATTEIDGAIASLGRSISIKLTRSGSGSIAKLSGASGTGTTLTLANVDDVVNFEVGQYLEANETDDATSVKTTTSNQGQITAVDRTSGIITLAAAIPSLAAGDYLFPRGDAGNALMGLDAWLPYDNRAARLAAPFFGVVRSVDSTRLGGLTYDGSALSPVESIIKAATVLGREGSRPDHVFVSFTDWGNINTELGAKVNIIDVRAGSEGAIGFAGLLINGPKGPMKVIPDGSVPKGRAFILQLNTWKLASLKKAVNLFDTDGLRMTRAQNTDALQVRCFSYSQLACSAPGWNCQVKLPA